MASLSALMSSTHLGCQEVVLPAVSSLAQGSKAAFVPYLPAVAARDRMHWVTSRPP
jgi:hypothetical protein